MTQQEIIKRLENITWLMTEVENTYVKYELEEITEAIKAQFNYSDDYEQEVKKVLNYAETMLNLDNIKIR